MESINPKSIDPQRIKPKSVEPKSSEAALRATARGLVQGVGFRIFVQRAAWQRGLRGYVRNMPDGAVEIVASGSRTLLDGLLDEIRRGPVGAHVSAG